MQSQWFEVEGGEEKVDKLMRAYMTKKGTKSMVGEITSIFDKLWN